MIDVFIDNVTSFQTGAIHIHVFERWEGHLTIYGGDGVNRNFLVPENTSPTERHPIILPSGALPPLMAALSAYLGQVEHPAQLRKDFEHIRDRHDLLVDHLLVRRR